MRALSRVRHRARRGAQKPPPRALSRTAAVASGVACDGWGHRQGSLDEVTRRHAVKRATIQVRRGSARALRQAGQQFIAAWHGGAGPPGEWVVTFASLAALFRTLTPRRWELIEVLQRCGPQSVRGLARRLQRDAKRVYEDVNELAQLGLIERTDDARMQVPFEIIHTHFDIGAERARAKNTGSHNANL